MQPSGDTLPSCPPGGTRPHGDAGGVMIVPRPPADGEPPLPRPPATGTLRRAAAFACILLLPSTALSISVVETGVPDKVTTTPPLSATAQDLHVPPTFAMPRPGVTLWDEIGHGTLRAPGPEPRPAHHPSPG